MMLLDLPSVFASYFSRLSLRADSDVRGVATAETVKNFLGWVGGMTV